MIYPCFIKEKDKIGVTAPSDGITKQNDLKRLDNATKNFKNKNINILETESVRKSEKGRSTSKEKRAKIILLFFYIRLIAFLAFNKPAPQSLTENGSGVLEFSNIAFIWLGVRFGLV